MQSRATMVGGMRDYDGEKMGKEKLDEVSLQNADLLEVRLGIPPQIATQAVERALREELNCTANDAAWFKPMVLNAKIVRNLRDLLAPFGFYAVDQHKFARTVNDNLGIAIVVCAGDGAVGSSKADPKSKYTKGKKTKDAIDANNQQLLPTFVSTLKNAEKQSDVTSDRKLLTWHLLYGRQQNGVLIEFALPRGISAGGVVEEYGERIYLGHVSLEDKVFGEIQVRVEPMQPNAEEFDVPVTLKGNP